MQYAQVTKGIVTNIGNTQPDATWFPFAGPVAIGWLYDGATFTPPPPVNPVIPPLSAWAKFQYDAQVALAKSDTTILRITEAVAKGKNTWASADVQAYLAYRDSLRLIVRTANGDPTQPFPVQPAYPAGT